MGCALGMKPKEVDVLCYEHTSRGGGKRKLGGIIGPSQPGIGRSRHIDVPAAKAGCDGGGNVFIQMKADRHSLGRFLQPLLAQLRFNERRMIAAGFVHQRPFSPHVILDLLDVIEVVGQRGMDVGEREGRDVRDDLVRAHPLVFRPYGDVEHADAVAGDASPATTHARCLSDPASRQRGHESSIAPTG